MGGPGREERERREKEGREKGEKREREGGEKGERRRGEDEGRKKWLKLCMCVRVDECAYLGMWV